MSLSQRLILRLRSGAWAKAIAAEKAIAMAAVDRSRMGLVINTSFSTA